MKEPPLWQVYRREFPVADRWAYFDHAAVAPIPERTRRRVQAWADESATNGIVNEGAMWREIESARAAAAQLMHAASEEIAFVANTSAGLSIVAEGFPWKPGDNVVVPEGEYPSNVLPWLHLADRGVEVRRVAQVDFRIPAVDVLAAFDERTRMLAISHVQFATGFRSDLVRLGAECKRRGVDFCVDAIQSLGALPVDVRAMEIDYLAADGHKWLLAPEGAGVLFVRAEKLEKLRPSAVGWKSMTSALDFGTSQIAWKPDAARFEPGTFNTPGVLGLGTSIELLLEAGVPRIARELRQFTDELIERLRTFGAEVASPRSQDEWSGIVSFAMAGVDHQAAVQRCRAAGVVLNCRAGRLRVSPHFYNAPADLDRLLDALVALR